MLSRPLLRREGHRKISPMALSPREREVLTLIAGGQKDREIAERLSISYRTVGRHVTAILRKLDAVNRVEAAVIGVRAGLV